MSFTVAIVRQSGSVFTVEEVGTRLLSSTVFAYFEEVVDGLGWHVRSRCFLLFTVLAHSISSKVFIFSLSFPVHALPNFLVFIAVVL